MNPVVNDNDSQNQFEQLIFDPYSVHDKHDQTLNPDSQFFLPVNLNVNTINRTKFLV